jgi:hypothetical protein
MEDKFMSTREMAHALIDTLSEEQLRGLLMLAQAGTFQKGKEKKSVRGIFSEYANTDLIPLEDTAWEKSVKEKYENT